MSQISEINEQILTKIDKTDEFYQALWGKEDFTPEEVITEPNDYNCGAIANQLEYINGYIEEITGFTLLELPDPYVDIAVFFFTGLKRFPDEATGDLLRRVYSLLIREAEWRSERFGTPWDIKNVFAYYVDRELLYYIQNRVITDILINGDFESAIGAEWTFTPSGDRSIGDPFTNDYKVDFTSFNSLEQTVAVTTGTYILNCFIKAIAGPPEGFAYAYDIAEPVVTGAAFTEQDFGFVEGSGPLPESEIEVFSLIVQRDSDSQYFNTETLSWQAGTPQNKFSTIGGEYQLAEFFIVADGSYNITITFSKFVDFYLDRVQFGKKLYPSFELLYIDSGDPEGFAFAYDIAETNVDGAAFTEQDFGFSSGTSNYSDQYYQNLLDTVKASGVEAIFVREVRG